MRCHSRSSRMEKPPCPLLRPGISAAQGILAEIVMLILGLGSPGLGATFPPGPGTEPPPPIKDPALINSCSLPKPDFGARMPLPGAGSARSRWTRAELRIFYLLPLWGCGRCFSVPVPCNARIGRGKIRNRGASFIPLFFFLVFTVRGLSFPVWISLRAFMAPNKKEPVFTSSSIFNGVY